MILSIAKANPKIKHNNTIPINPGPPSINFCLIIWWNDADSSSDIADSIIAAWPFLSSSDITFSSITSSVAIVSASCA